MTPKDVQEAKERVMRNEGYLHIKRLPKNTAAEIIEFLSNEAEFNGDWAMGMKYIWDTFKGALPLSDGAIRQSIEDLYCELETVKEQLNKLNTNTEQSTGKRMADGSVR